MDPIGLATGLIALVEVSCKLVLTCYEYHQSVKNAADDVSRILSEAASIRNVAERLIEMASRTDGAALPTLQAMASSGGLLDMFLKELGDLNRLLQPGKKSNRVFALKWPLTKSETEKSFAAMGRIKATLQLALAADTAENVNTILGHSKTLPEIESGVSYLVKQEKKGDYESEIFRLLRGRDQEPKLQEEAPKRVDGTGEWLVNHESYVEWKAKPGQLLWLHGNYLQDLCGPDSKKSLCYYFFDGSDQESTRIETIYRSLISQLLRQCKDELYDGDLSKLQDDLEELQRGSPRSKRRVAVKPLESILTEMFDRFDDNYVAIDGLDECEDPDALEKFVQSLGKVVGKRAFPVHLVALSRPIERLQAAFESLSAVHIAIENRNIENDLETALRVHLASHRRFARWPASLKDSVETTLLSRANGCFRWLDCQLQELKKCATPGAVRNALKHLPSSLQMHYARVLDKINPKDQVSVRNLLRWVTFACRPLSLDEVAAAIAINAETKEVPFVDEDLELFDVDDFIDSCSSLISVYRGPDNGFGLGERFVHLAHYSVKEFLVTDAFKDDFCPEFGLEERSAEACLAKSCLAYFVQTDGHESEDFWDSNLLACYAGRFWLRHMEASSEGWELAALRDLAVDLFDADKPYFQTWVRIATVDRPWLKEGVQEEDEETEKYTPLYCAAWHGLEHVIESLLARGASLEAPSCGLYGNPLQAAAKNGHVHVVKRLLAAKVDVDAAGGRYASAMGAAASSGHAEVIRALLDAGASPQPRRRYFDDGRSDPLFLAVASGSLEAVRLLLERGASDYLRRKARPGSALDFATHMGRLDIVQEFLRHEHIVKGNSIDTGCPGVIRSYASGFGASQDSAAMLGHREILRELAPYEMDDQKERLWHAARAGDLLLVRECLDNGADTEKEGGDSWYRRPIDAAASGGHVEVVRELLARGAEIGEQSLDGAVVGESIEIVKLLADAGAEINGRWCRPIRNALGKKHKNWEIAEFLVSRGADLHCCLQEAAAKGDAQVFEWLIRFGADIHRREPQDEAPILQAAARGGSIYIIEHLLDNGMVPDPPPGEGCPTTAPLMEAIRSRNWTAMRLLLDRGADVNAVPSSEPEPRCSSWSHIKGLRWPPKIARETPLALAAKAGNEEACFELIRRGALIGPATTGTLLPHAVWEGLSGLVDELLRRGADPNRLGTEYRGYKPSTPLLLLAAERRNMRILQHLVAAGADVNAQDAEGFSPLHVAAAPNSGYTQDNTDVLNALIHQYHADVNRPRLLNGSRPLHSAASRGPVAHVQVLLDAGADINALNDDGRTPLHWAAERGRWDVIELLVDRGADVNVKSKEESLQTPLQLAHTARDNSVQLWDPEDPEDWDEKRIDALLARMEGAGNE